MVPVTIKDGNTHTYARSGKPFRETALKFKQKLVCVRFYKSVKYTNLVPCSNKEMAFFQAVYLSTRMENRSFFVVVKCQKLSLCFSTSREWVMPRLSHCLAHTSHEITFLRWRYSTTKHS